ncbi:MAG: hypothetical protein R3C15_22235 [Thermoleophilia bacterium]
MTSSTVAGLGTLALLCVLLGELITSARLALIVALAVATYGASVVFVILRWHERAPRTQASAGSASAHGGADRGTRWPAGSNRLGLVAIVVVAVGAGLGGYVAEGVGAAIFAALVAAIGGYVGVHLVRGAEK